jgi:hypothetical protein
MSILEIALTCFLAPIVIAGMLWKFVIKPMVNREKGE